MRAWSFAALAAAVGLGTVPGIVCAQSPLKLTPTLAGRLTLTDNVDLAPSDRRQADVIFELTPGLRIDYNSARAKLNGSISAPILIYAETNAKNSRVLPAADLVGSVEVIDNFFFVDAAAGVSQTFFSPFAPRPVDLSTATENRYTASTYRITPYIRGELADNIRYELRDDNRWSTLGDGPVESQRLYTNSLTGTIARHVTPFGWGVDISRIQHEFPEQTEAQVLEHARLRLVYRPTVAWQFFASGGYEHNRLALADTDGPTYGAGIGWRPNERTALDAGWEHRFFGESYYLTFSHRAPRTAWAVRASRNITSFPEVLARLQGGSFVPAVLNQVFASRIPDPTERARFILDYMRERGLPLFLSAPLALFSQQIFLHEEANATFGIIGARNTVFFTVYRAKTEPLIELGAAVPPQFAGTGNDTQYGTGVVWTHALTPSATMRLSADASRAEANPPFSGHSDHYSVRLAITRPISPRTTAHAGARYQLMDSTFQPGYREAAVFVGINHAFR